MVHIFITLANINCINYFIKIYLIIFEHEIIIIINMNHHSDMLMIIITSFLIKFFNIKMIFYY